MATAAQPDFAQSTTLFNRTVRVTIDTLLITDLDIEFSIEKDLKKAPNNADVTIYNLNPDHRAALEQLKAKDKASKGTKGIPCLIEAGYGTDYSQIFLGDLRTVETIRQGPDWQTKLTSGDGEKGAQFARVQLSYAAGVTNETVLRALARAMNIGEGNLSKAVAGLKHIFPAGVTISGPAYRQLNTLAAGMGLTVTIQDSALQFQNLGKALSGTALKLNASTGLIDSPTVDNEGVLNAKMLMIPGVRVGSLIVMDSLAVKGQYIVQKTVYAGSSFTGDFGITVQGKRY
jgi:hypothetical protein